jgi:hypothetical protein
VKDKRFRPYESDRSLLLPPTTGDRPPDGHPASFTREVVGKLDLFAIRDACADGKVEGRARA